jgi:hypothetical protein
MVTLLTETGEVAGPRARAEDEASSPVPRSPLGLQCPEGSARPGSEATRRDVTAAGQRTGTARSRLI